LLLAWGVDASSDTNCAITTWAPAPHISFEFCTTIGNIHRQLIFVVRVSCWKSLGSSSLDRPQLRDIPDIYSPLNGTLRPIRRSQDISPKSNI
jgi:hypothetical protein